MARRLNTIIIVPHNKAKFHKFSFSTRSFVIASCCLAVAFILSIVAISYTGSAVNRRVEAQHLKTENADLLEANRELEHTISTVQARLDEFEQRTSRLALAAGMETDGVDGVSHEENTNQVGAGGPYDRVLESPETLQNQSDWIAANLDRIGTKLEDQGREFSSKPTIAPAIGVITDGFGGRKDPFTGRRAFHRGLDLSARRGTPIVAPADGIVVFAERNGGLGKTLRLSHGFGVVTVYGHLNKILVENGQEVHRGDQIATIGSTGRSTGPHLHYEVHVDGKAVNPLYYILDAF